MDLQKILSSLVLIGSDLPAYKALFDQVVLAFAEDDQAALREAYEKAKARSDAAHQAAQSL